MLWVGQNGQQLDARSVQAVNRCPGSSGAPGLVRSIQLCLPLFSSSLSHCSLFFQFQETYFVVWCVMFKRVVKRSCTCKYGGTSALQVGPSSCSGCWRDEGEVGGHPHLAVAFAPCNEEPDRIGF